MALFSPGPFSIVTLYAFSFQISLMGNKHNLKLCPNHAMPARYGMSSIFPGENPEHDCTFVQFLENIYPESYAH